MSKDCKVCGRPDSGTHSAFGGRSCHSCRIFFRRMVLANRMARLECLNAGTDQSPCSIDSRSWKSCQWCRFNRCKERAGMQEELVVVRSSPFIEI